MNFWFVMFFLTAISVLLLSLVFLRKQAMGMDGQQQRILRNIRLYQQRLAQLQGELEQQYINQDVYDSLYNELSRQLLNDVSLLENAPAQGHVRRKWLFLLLPAPLLAIAIYGAIGAYPDWQITKELSDLANSQSMADYNSRIEALHDRLETRLRQRPDHIEYRILLARYAMGKEDYQQASAHYGVLAELLPDDADVWGYYAQAEYLRASRQITPLVADAIDRALQLNPLQKTVLGLQGIHAYEQGKLPEAIAAWEKLLVALGDDGDTAAMIRQGIASARAQLGQSGEKAVAIASGIDVEVNLGDQLPELDPSLTVFVYAKAASGPPMPLAVKRMQLRDVPARIRLDDSMAMMPQMTLSQYDEVVIGARISFSGQPVGKKGDWQGETGIIAWKDAGKAEVTIDRMVQ